jgi:hypothetical protein
VKAKTPLLYKIVWGFMAAVFFFAATPHDFIHDELAHHTDTVDGYHKHAGVSTVHIHCEFLRVSLSPTLPGTVQAVVLHQTLHQLRFSEPVFSSPETFTFHYYLRGPPPGAC